MLTNGLLVACGFEDELAGLIELDELELLGRLELDELAGAAAESAGPPGKVPVVLWIHGA